MRQLFCQCESWQISRETKYKIYSILSSRFTVSIWQDKFRIFSRSSRIHSLACQPGMTGRYDNPILESTLSSPGQGLWIWLQGSYPVLGLDPYCKINKTLPVKDHASASATNLLLMGLYVVVIGSTHSLPPAMIGRLPLLHREKKTKRDKE